MGRRRMTPDERAAVSRRMRKMWRKRRALALANAEPENSNHLTPSPLVASLNTIIADATTLRDALLTATDPTLKLRDALTRFFGEH